MHTRKSRTNPGYFQHNRCSKSIRTDRKDRMQELIKRTPIPTAGVALGLAALGNLLQPLSEGIRIACGVLALLLVVLLMAKVILFPRMIREDLSNPILASVSATFAMTLMQLSGYLAPVSMTLAFSLWIAAVSGHITLILWFSLRYFRPFKLDQVFPTYFICYVGIIVASATSPIFGVETIGRAMFWFGFACYIPLLALITLRYLKHPVPGAARPLFCIYSAPASLSIVGYLAVTPDPSLAFTTALLALAQIFFILVLTQLPKFLSLGFFPSYAAMTFPFVITATALTRFIESSTSFGIALPAAIEWAMVAETVFACTMVLFVFVRYLHFLFAPLLKSLLRKEEEILAAEAAPKEQRAEN